MLDSDLVAAVFNRGKYIFFKQKDKSPDRVTKAYSLLNYIRVFVKAFVHLLILY